MALPKINNGDVPPTSIFASQLKKKENKRERNIVEGSISRKNSIDENSREENVLGEDGSAEELEQAGSPFA